jgi:hypothetical protein
MSPTPREVLENLLGHPHGPALCARAAQVVLAAAARRNAACLGGPEVAELDTGALEPLTREQSATRFGDLLEILDRGAQSQTEWLLVAVAVSIHLGRRWPSVDAPSTLDQLFWLCDETPCNVWLTLDDCLDGPASEALWGEALPILLRQSHRCQIAVAAGLSGATSEGALRLKRELAAHTDSPTVRMLLDLSTPAPALQGELARPPAKPWSLALQAITGWLVLRTLASVVMRFVLGSRRRARLRVTRRGLEISTQRRLLGRDLMERTQFIPLGELSSLACETRFHGLGIYVGLMALGAGTYIGSGLLVDALRVTGGSPTLAGFGLLTLLGGLALDFAFTTLGDHRKGKTRVIITPHRGTRFALAKVDALDAEAWLKRLSVLSALNAPVTRPSA